MCKQQQTSQYIIGGRYFWKTPVGIYDHPTLTPSTNSITVILAFQLHVCKQQ